jgi:heat shock 70kDa protein 1/2/6/8
VFEVKAMGGDTNLGGEDFIQRLVEFCHEEFKLQSGNTVDLSPDYSAMQKLRIQCENAKRALSNEEEVIVKVDKIYHDYDLKVNITKQKFEELCFDLFQRCLPPLAHAMKAANVTINDITDVVLTGGIYQMPILSNMLEEFFQGKHI